jgi:tetratricopeptide (TPR) repeat protein
VKRSLAVTTLLAVAGIAAALAYLAASRQRDYGLALARGDTALRDDQTFAAIEAYSGAIALRQDSMIAYVRRGQTYQRRGDRGDLERAANDFRTAAALDPSAPRPLEALGDVQYQLQRYDRAVEAYERFLRLDDRSPRVSYRLALARYRQRDIDGAIAALTDSIRLDERVADAHYLLGLCLRERKRPNDAARAFERAVALEPGMVAAREELADLYGARDRTAEEIEQLQLLAGLDRDRVSRWVAIALAHARAGHWDLAVLTLGGAIERNPNESDIYRALGQIWLERPRDDRAYLSKAREALERVALSPDATSRALTLYARALQQEGNVDAAEHALQEATARFPIELQALLLYATAAERNSHLDAARQALVQYIGLAPAEADVTTLCARIGTLSLRLKEPQAAVAWFTRAAGSGSDVRLLASLADAQIRSGDADAARATLARALDKDPRNPQLLALAGRAR